MVMVMARRPLLVALSLVAVLGLFTGIRVVAVVTRPGPVADRALPAPPAEPDGLRVLRAWDARRARAYARRDEAALAALYVPGSRTGAADRAVLRGYRERGLGVTGMRTQVLGARVLRESARRLVVLVTDVLVDGVADDGHGRRWSLPRDRPSTRRVVLVRRGGDWRVAEVYPDK